MKTIKIPKLPECDLCHATDQPVMYNTPVKGYGCWGNLCQSCFEHDGIDTSVTERLVLHE